MERLSRSFAAKFTIYLLLLVSIMAAAAAGTVVACNVGYNWYSDREGDVREEIYSEVAEHVGGILHEYAYYNLEEENDDMQPAIYGEERAANFGYVIYRNAEPSDEAVNNEAADNESSSATGRETVRAVNSQLGDEEGVYRETVYSDKTVTIEVYLGDMEKGGVPNEVGYIYDLYEFLYKYRNVAAVTAAVAVIVSLVLLVVMICAVGRDEKRGSFVARLPMDVIVAAAFFIALMAVEFAYYPEFAIINHIELMMSVCALALVAAVIVTGVILIFAVQAKAGRWWRHTLIYNVCSLIIKGFAALFGVFRRVNLVWKTGLAVLAATAVNLIIVLMALYTYGGATSLVLWFIGAVITAAAVIYTALCMKRLQEGGKRLAEGDMGYKIDTNGLFLDLKEHAEDLNDIGNGMARAVEERLRSERFKTELITNVSHDIKTPITSIINYVDFLKREKIDNEKAREYIEVLDRQSQRLKKLTEDLVEASKAATGNVSLDLMPCDTAVMMNQVMGEYQEKAERAQLELVMNLPEESVSIMADGRSMWRVLDNLMNNICKYSQPGTRVYQTLEIKDGKAVITYRNTSKYELNISGDELTERFVRGDSSRHTEGSGLGLSIAKNLVELQGGSFEIYIDGDLFKTIIEFDVI